MTERQSKEGLHYLGTPFKGAGGERSTEVIVRAWAETEYFTFVSSLDHPSPYQSHRILRFSPFHTHCGLFRGKHHHLRLGRLTCRISDIIIIIIINTQSHHQPYSSRQQFMTTWTKNTAFKVVRGCSSSNQSPHMHERLLPTLRHTPPPSRSGLERSGPDATAPGVEDCVWDDDDGGGEGTSCSS